MSPKIQWGSALVVVVILASGCGRKDTGEQKSLAAQMEQTSPPLEPAKNVNISVPTAPKVLELSGTAQPSRTSRISAKASGILRSVLVREGERVNAGQVLCILDPTDIALRKEGASIGQMQALEALENAKNDLNRAEQLFKARALSDSAIDKARLGMRIANLQAQAAEVGVRMAQQALADTKLRAPFPGVVTKLMAEEGQMITTMPPTVIFVLVDTDTLEVRVPIPERILYKVRVDMPVIVQLPALRTQRPAKIDRIAEVIDPSTRAAEAIIRLENRDHSLPGGLYAMVRFPDLTDEDIPEASSNLPSDVPANGR
jgi:RND family efflux transporter MFP subunit